MENRIKVGNIVRAIVWVWREDERPTDENFFTGRVKQVISKSRFVQYVKIEGLDKLIPMDRVKLA
ncbi:MAG: hypothetical protein MUC29_07295 [Pyrinomonadaceae bacterium]|jgi:hypothetical protein|nr:hypothetical protein [Pyrinomonadaceae bacterium]